MARKLGEFGRHCPLFPEPWWFAAGGGRGRRSAAARRSGGPGAAGSLAARSLAVAAGFGRRVGARGAVGCIATFLSRRVLAGRPGSSAAPRCGLLGPAAALAAGVGGWNPAPRVWRANLANSARIALCFRSLGGLRLVAGAGGGPRRLGGPAARGRLGHWRLGHWRSRRVSAGGSEREGPLGVSRRFYRGGCWRVDPVARRRRAAACSARPLLWRPGSAVGIRRLAYGAQTWRIRPALPFVSGALVVCGWWRARAAVRGGSAVRRPGGGWVTGGSVTGGRGGFRPAGRSARGRWVYRDVFIEAGVGGSTR